MVGTSLEDTAPTTSSARFAKAAVDEFGTHKLTDEQWDEFAERLTYVPQGAGPEALAAAVAEAEAAARAGRAAGCTTCSVPPEGRPGGDHDAARRRTWSSAPGW